MSDNSNDTTRAEMIAWLVDWLLAHPGKGSTHAVDALRYTIRGRVFLRTIEWVYADGGITRTQWLDFITEVHRELHRRRDELERPYPFGHIPV